MELFSEDSVLMFHSRSRDAEPGVGVGETLSDPSPDFSALRSYPDWRQRLSNFAPAPFTLDGLRWATVEHYFQGSKFAEVDPDYYRSFALDSGSALARSNGAAARSAGGRRGRPLTAVEVALWDARKRGVMRRALEAKFRENAEHRAILLATQPAKLTHRPLRSAHTQVEHGLMEVRAVLRAEATGGVPPPQTET